MNGPIPNPIYFAGYLNKAEEIERKGGGELWDCDIMKEISFPECVVAEG